MGHREIGASILEIIEIRMRIDYRLESRDHHTMPKAANGERGQTKHSERLRFMGFVPKPFLFNTAFRSNSIRLPHSIDSPHDQLVSALARGIEGERTLCSIVHSHPWARWFELLDGWTARREEGL